MKLKIPIGLDDFKRLIEDNYTYVDKTLFIEDVIESTASVLLITRPRRFGKTLNMSMLANFFDHRQSNQHLFKGLKIEQRRCFKECGTRPTIFLSFKSLKAGKYEIFSARFAEMVSTLYKKHQYLMEGLDEFDLDDFRLIASKKANEGLMVNAISKLMYWLERAHGQKVMLLIDEYDNPIQEAYSYGYYEQVIPFMRGVLGEALKTNTALHKAVLTGILRVAKESIFSDLNNVEVFSVLSYDFADQFGFTEDDVAHLLEMADHHEAELVQSWYNGYQIGEKIIYNPWSLLSYLKKWREGPEAYWVNTSSNDLIYKQIMGASSDAQDTLKALMNGGEVRTHLNQHISLRDIGINDKNLWSLLLFSGYLTVRASEFINKKKLYTLSIPNLEVLTLFETIISDWMQTNIGTSANEELLEALIAGNTERFGQRLGELVEAIFSFYDTAGKQEERVYHIFVLGLLAQLTHRFTIRSNRESGLGRYDLIMLPKEGEERGIIMEFKRADNINALETALDAAHQQIAERRYEAELDAAGVPKRSIIAVAFCGKTVRLRAIHR